MLPRATIRLFLCSLVGYCAALLPARAQTGVGINTTGAAPHTTALLDLREPNAADRTKGLLIPRIALTATNATAPVPTPAVGLLVYNTTIAGTGQYRVTPGFYIWDATGRWARYEALVRRPTAYKSSDVLTTPNSAAWSTVTATNTPQSPSMYLYGGDRVEFKIFGTVAPAALGAVAGEVEVAVSYDNGVSYVSLPPADGFCSTAFSMDNGVQNFSGPGGSGSIAKFTPRHNWSMEGYYVVPGPGSYKFALRMRRTASTVNITSAAGTSTLVVEVIRP